MYQRSVKAKRWRVLFTTRSFTILLGLGILVISVSLTKEIIRKVEIHRQITQLEQQISDLESHNDQLNDMMAYFNSSNFQEKQAKTKLGLAEPGETMVVLPQATTTTADQGAADTVAVASSQALNQSIYSKWQHYFFK